FFVRNSQCPLVFIVSGSRSGEGSLWSLFPKEIQEELHMSCISFNPVPATTMMKVLKNIVYMEAEKSHKSLYVPEKAELEMLCSGSSGDIRSAINSLQFCCLLGKEKGLCTLKKPPAMSLKRAAALSKQKGKQAKSAKEQEEHQAIGGKDVSFFLFRALGKILHCKRGNGDCPNETKGASELVLPFHLLQHHREVLLVQPELVVERSETSGEFFTLCLHQNYLDFFSDIEDVDRASEYLSDADLLTGNWTGDHHPGLSAQGNYPQCPCNIAELCQPTQPTTSRASRNSESHPPPGPCQPRSSLNTSVTSSPEIEEPDPESPGSTSSMDVGGIEQVFKVFCSPAHNVPS
ncbi:hypothetical protein CCH79_00019342, partial [Gambusia affinis]